jgi:uncharacterized GH25 family protein
MNPRRTGSMRFAIGIASLLAWGVASAHESWLHAASARVAPGDVLLVGLNSGMAFPTLDHAVQRDRLDAAAIDCPGAPRAALRPDGDEATLRFALRCASQGIARLDVVLKPRNLTLRDAQIDEYLDEIGADAALRAQATAQRGKVPWTETYTKTARLVVAVGEGGSDDAWRTAAGSGDELVALTPWAALRAGEALAVRLLHDGQPVAGVAVGLRSAGETHSRFATTDADGVARFDAVRGGATLLHAVQLAADGDGNWRSRFVTLAYESPAN